ncbi:iron complex transport system permease protein [Kribbella aluminosa]|uniref:Iron complex transport system permease protein n=1 Tax=Kribbella aluminosa TaxID=416017 RepID=A0ABS4UWD3_9ACTN|nr:iron ABC transporter permease [Kribbella aluminosa]MBP2355856.1 iron complex transport system permease protein [Kribbella aluminosa]
MTAVTSVIEAGPEAIAAEVVRDHGIQQRRRRLTVAGLGLLLLVAVVGDVMVGGEGLRLADTVRALFTPWHAPTIDEQIVWNIRMPMTATGVLVGAALALAGAEMQTILNNPLAEPYTLGVSAAASFGAALSLVAGLSALPLGSLLGTAGMAWVFAMLASAVIIAFSIIRGPHTETMVLLGIAMVFLFTALLSLLQYVASDAQLQQVVFWTLGSLSRASWQQVAMMAVVLAIAVPLLLRASWQLTAMRLGDDRARALGVNVAKVRIVVLAGISLVAATGVAIAGSIAFVGLVGPHVARMLVGENHRHFVPASMFGGALLLVASSLVSKLLVPGVIIPVGIITSIVGVPVFLGLILSRRRQLWA